VGTVDAVATPLVVLDEQLQILFANQAFYESYGGTARELESRSLFEVPEWNIPRLQTGLSAFFAGGGNFPLLEVEGTFPRIGKRTLSFTARPLRWREARPLILLAVEDVSARKQAEVERVLILRGAQQARETAERANHTKDAFLATLSHELRTPIATILMNAQLMRHQGLGPEKIVRISESIERSAKTQSRLIEDLLDVSRIVTGKLNLSLQRLDLLDVIPYVIESVSLQAERKKIHLELKLSEETAPIAGDSPRLQQVLSNLLTNAIKFTPEGGTVTVSLNSEHGEVLLSVSDTGKGIAAEFLPFVFERFSQQENSSVRKYGGLGLGLSIVRDIVELHGGKVRASSGGVDKGATFLVILPLLHSPVAGPLPAPRLASAPDLSQLQGLRILVVDDDPENLESVIEMLRVHGAEVTSAGSTEQALLLAQEPGLQVIIADVVMPVSDGYALIRAIRALPSREQSSVPAIALTAVAGIGAGGRKRAFEAGFQEYMEKPADIDQLVQALIRLSQPKIRA
jgi:two-component system, chemotaxis family, CheB/CheR fusion protein